MGPTCDVPQTLDSGWGLRMDFSGLDAGLVTGSAGPPCDVIGGSTAEVSVEVLCPRPPPTGVTPWDQVFCFSGEEESCQTPLSKWGLTARG